MLALSHIKPALSSNFSISERNGFRLWLRTELPVYFPSEASQLSLLNLLAPVSGLLMFLFSQHNNFQTATSDKDWRQNKCLSLGPSETDPLLSTWPVEDVVKQYDPSKREKEGGRETL